MKKKLLISLTLTALIFTAVYLALTGGFLGELGSGYDQPDDPGPRVNQLAFATLSLEDTENAVQPDQASGLPLHWKGMRSLSSSRLSSTIEIQALLNQIEASMTTGQLAAADSLDLNAGAAGKANSTLASSTAASSQTSTESGTTPPSQVETASSGGMPGDLGAPPTDGDASGMMGSELPAGDAATKGQLTGLGAGTSSGGSITININLAKEVIAVLEQKTT